MENLEIPLLHFNEIPAEVANINPTQIRRLFPHPSLIELKGKKEETLFVSLLLHGNETTSFYVLQKLLAYLKKHPLQKSLTILVGNVYATEKNKRFLEHQKDYNRIWKQGDEPEHTLAQKIKSHILKKKLFACIDIHNNTGTNPFYACINKLETQYIYLAQLFSRTLVYFQKPDTALSSVFATHCPSVTLECGQSGQAEGVNKAFHFILDVLNHQSLDHPLSKLDFSIYETMAKLSLPVDLNIGFTNSTHDISFPEHFEQLNFQPLEKGALFARHSIKDQKAFELINDDGLDIFDQYFIQTDHEIYLKESFIPSMFTKNIEVIKQDCLGYIMKEISLNK